MQDLIKQEQFELDALDRLNSGKFLKYLIFGGGTMLRLCFGLNRFSVDLDFWSIKNCDRKKLFNELKNYLSKFYTLTDCTDKFYTLLFEIKSKGYPKKLKIEIRKETRAVRTQKTIAYSRHSNVQVLLNVVSPDDMMASKIEAFLDRKEIRDVFDIEFLFKKGIELAASKETLKKLLAGIESLSKKDYTVKLGSILEADQRKYYVSENFKIIKLAIQEKLRINS